MGKTMYEITLPDGYKITTNNQAIVDNVRLIFGRKAEILHALIPKEPPDYTDDEYKQILIDSFKMFTESKQYHQVDWTRE
jgi:hypothetical protein